MRYTTLLFTALLAACAPEAGQMTMQNDSSEPKETIADLSASRITGDPHDLAKRLIAVVGLKDNGLPLEVSGDSFTGGEKMHGLYSNGMVDIFTMPGGAIWKVRVTSGVGSVCGKKVWQLEDVEAVLAVSNPLIDHGDSPAQLLPALTSGGMKQVESSGLRYGATGGCLKSITVTDMLQLPEDNRV